MSRPEPIAVVGLDCRFPGARNAEEFWQLLVEGRDGTSRVPAERWDADLYHAPLPSPGSPAGAPGPNAPGRSNTLRGGFIDDPDAFDPQFFGISPREAESMDPQQRLLLQSSWRAIEDAGVAPQDLADTDTGVFVGVMANEWAILHLSDYENITSRYGSGNGYFMGANRVSYHLDLKGPSMAVDTACSSSLVAVHLASNALRSGECDYALAGGTNLIMTPILNIFYTQAGLSAPDGRCKPFASSADGIGRAEGVAVLVLRRLSDALADRQQVYAVIDASGTNQDGRSNGVTAPSRWAQQRLLENVWKSAQVTADDIDFIEGHGTGTVLGDMIEIQALGHLTADRATGGRDPIALGSVKSNFGHAEGAAGVAGFVKTVLALHHRTVPPSRFAEDENRNLQLGKQGLSLVTSPKPLPDGTVRAAVSSFGMGGSNAHVVMSSAPDAARRPAGGAPGVFTVTASTPEALRRNLLVQAEALSRQPESRPAQLCWTSNRVKSRLPHRASAVGRDPIELAAGLRAAAEQAVDGSDTTAKRGIGGRSAVAFVFPGAGVSRQRGVGQGEQLCRAAECWSASSPVFARLLDEIDQRLAAHLGKSVRAALLDGDEAVRDGELARPAQFAVEYAMAGTLMEAGIRPAFVLGAGTGELAAACVSGALDPDHAARLAVRGECADLPSRAPALPFFSAGHGRCLAEGEAATTTAEEVRDALGAGYWAQWAEAEPGGTPERFAAAAAELLAAGATHTVEFGPDGALTPELAQLRTQTAAPVSAHAAHPGADATPYPLHTLLAELWRAGLEPKWDALYEDCDRVPVRLPGYVFDNAFRSWRSADNSPAAARLAAAAAPAVAESADEPVADQAAEADAGTPAPSGTPAVETPDDVVELTYRMIGRVGGHAPARVLDHARLYEDLGFDSIMLMELHSRLEKELPQLGDIPVDELLDNLETVGDLARFLRDQAAQAAEGSGA